MKTISILCCLLFAGLVMAADAVVGVWDSYATSPEGEQMKFVLTIKEEGGRLSAVAAGERGEPFPLLEFKGEGEGVYTFKANMDRGSYTVKLKVTGDSFNGRWSGEGESGDLKGTRRG